jgi:steroid delta-isomerase-like uncharacterized protein
MSNTESIMRRWFDEVWNKGNEAAVDEMFPADGIAHGLGEEVPVRGPQEFKVFARNLRSAVADLYIAIEDIVATGDKGVARFKVTGTHRGHGLGIPPSGKKVSIDGITIVRIANGQIVEGWNSWDQLGLLKQIGAIPSAGEANRFLTAQT